MISIINKIHLFVCILRSLPLNFKQFTFSQAIKCPILLGINTWISPIKRGQIKILGGAKFRMISIGVTNGSFEMGEKVKTRIIIKKEGEIVFNGKSTISAGSRIIVNQNASICFGKGVFLNNGTIINAGSSISIGDNFLGGWNVSMIDGDGHEIIDIEKNVVCNSYKPIIIGKNCWVAAAATILKGVLLADNTIVPYGSIITKSSTVNNCIYGGQPNKILKTNIIRK